MEEEDKKAIKKDSNNKIRFTILAIILISIFCFAITPVTLQNDTYYTIKIGEHVLQNGIDMQDPFSWHEGLSYTYPHWAYDVITYLVYNFFGFLGVYVSTVIICIILGITLYVTNNKLMKNRVTSFFITIVAMYLLKDFIAARAQLVTFILFVLTVYFIEMFLDTKKKRYAIGLITIPILIANIHSAVFPFYFVLYLPYIGEYGAYILSNIGIIINASKIKQIHKKVKKIKDENKIEKIREKVKKLEERQNILLQRQEKRNRNAYKIKIERNNNIKYLVIIMIICLFAGLLTPIGLTPYTYLIKTMQGDTTKNISEHLPLILSNNLEIMSALVVFLAILTFTDTKIRLRDLFMLGGLVFLTFYSRRQASIFILLCSFVLNRLVCTLFSKYDPDGCIKIQNKITNIIGMITTIALVLIISIPIYKPKIDDNILDESTYPVQAANYILAELDINNIKLYNEYNYGSYLLYKGIPVFIDSRADLYSPEFNPGVEVFHDFLNLSGVNISNIEEKLDEYGITHLIMYKGSKLKIFISQNEEKYKLLYEDDSFYIYERKTT